MSGLEKTHPKKHTRKLRRSTAGPLKGFVRILLSRCRLPRVAVEPRAKGRMSLNLAAAFPPPPCKAAPLRLKEVFAAFCLKLFWSDLLKMTKTGSAATLDGFILASSGPFGLVRGPLLRSVNLMAKRYQKLNS